MTEGLSFDSVVTIGLGGLTGLSKGLATRRERDLEQVSDTSYSSPPQNPSQETAVIPSVEGTRTGRGHPGVNADRSTLRLRIPPVTGRLGDGLRIDGQPGGE